MPSLPSLPDAATARRAIGALQAHLAHQGISFRPPPPEPTTCCGRGCNGCVWEGWLAAANWWHDQALALLQPAPAPDRPCAQRPLSRG